MTIEITITDDAAAILAWRAESMGQTVDALVAECAQSGVDSAVGALRGAYEAAQQAAKLAIVEAFDAADDKATKAEIIAAAAAPKVEPEAVADGQ